MPLLSIKEALPNINTFVREKRQNGLMNCPLLKASGGYQSNPANRQDNTDDLNALEPLAQYHYG
jgi:hypothetical protein